MSWIDPDFPRTAEPTDLVGRVLGLNPGMLTGPGRGLMETINQEEMVCLMTLTRW